MQSPRGLLWAALDKIADSPGAERPGEGFPELQRKPEGMSVPPSGHSQVQVFREQGQLLILAGLPWPTHGSALRWRRREWGEPCHLSPGHLGVKGAGIMLSEIICHL